MKPLHGSQIPSFLSRFESFEQSEIRAITLKAPTVIEIHFSVQDSARGFDWIDVAIECATVTDARLIENTKLSYLDMSEEISICQVSQRCTIPFTAIA